MCVQRHASETKMNINREIVRLAIPSILANITIPLVGLVDTAIAGHIADAAAIGGIAVAATLFNFIYWPFEFLRIGTSGLTAQAYGRGEDTAPIMTRSLLMAGLGSGLILALQYAIVSLALWFIPCSEEVAHMARHYFSIRVWAAPATLALMGLKGFFIGMSDTVSAMVVDIAVNVLNIVGSYTLCVTIPHYFPALDSAHVGAYSVASGTLIAQWFGLILALLIVARKYHFARPAREWRKVMVMNADYIIRSICFLTIYVGYTYIATIYGDTELAISAIYMNLFMFFSYFVDGYAYAGEALVGRYIDGDCDTVVRRLFVHALAVGGIFTLLFLILGDNCIALVTNDATILSTAGRYLGWLVVFPLLSTLAFLWDGIYTGATASGEIRNGMILAALAFLATYFGLRGILPFAHVLYAAYMAHLIARTAYLSIKWNKIRN